MRPSSPSTPWCTPVAPVRRNPSRAHPMCLRWSAAMLACVLSGCASVHVDQSIADTNAQAHAFTQGNLALAQTTEQRTQQAQTTETLLASPVSQAQAVKLALVNSPAVQALLATHWEQAARAAQGGRIANPTLTLERLHTTGELEIGRLLSWGLLDVLTLPLRYQSAQREMAQQQITLTRQVIDLVTQVRMAWVKAVAAQQNASYAQQVMESAQASADIAQRLQQAGNISQLQQARQHVFYVQASTQLAQAQHQQLAAKETLVRLLGLDDAQAQQLQLPEHLPALPSTPRSAASVSEQASQARMDVQWAQAQYANAAQAQGLAVLTNLTDIELGVRHDSTKDKGTGEVHTKRGFEVSVRLPLFDNGSLQRDAMNARTLAAAQQLESTVRAAGSHLRQSYSAYRTSLAVAQHYHQELLPLMDLIAQENVLRYNGMLIGVLELLSDTRTQINTVMAAIAADEQFWLNDAALQAALMGQASMAPSTSMGGMGGMATGDDRSSGGGH